MSEPCAEAQTATFTIVNLAGIHLRPAQLIARTSSGFADCSVMVSKGEVRVNAKSIMGLTELVGACGEQVTFEVCGGRAEQCLDELRRLFSDGFGEELAPEYLNGPPKSDDDADGEPFGGDGHRLA